MRLSENWSFRFRYSFHSVNGYTSHLWPILHPEISKTKPEVHKEALKTQRFLEIIPLGRHNAVSSSRLHLNRYKWFFSVNVLKYTPLGVSNHTSERFCIQKDPKQNQKCTKKRWKHIDLLKKQQIWSPWCHHRLTSSLRYIASCFFR